MWTHESVGRPTRAGPAPHCPQAARPFSSLPLAYFFPGVLTGLGRLATYFLSHSAPSAFAAHPSRLLTHMAHSSFRAVYYPENKIQAAEGNYRCMLVCQTHRSAPCRGQTGPAPNYLVYCSVAATRLTTSQLTKSRFFPDAA